MFALGRQSFPQSSAWRLSTAALLLLPGLVMAGSSPPAVGVGDRRLDDQLAQLSQAPADPLIPFRLELHGPIQRLKDLADVTVQGYLRAKDDVYLHVALPPNAELDRTLPCDIDFDVLEGDFYYHNGIRLVEASLLARDRRGNEHALDALQRALGKPEFEVVLPGALSLVVGFRTSQGFLLGTFDDLPIFRLSAFSNDPADIMAGSQMLVFEGLSDYSARLAAGESQKSLLQSLMNVVNQAGMARNLIKNGR